MFKWALKYHENLNNNFPCLIFAILFINNMYINMLSSFEIQYQPVKEM